MSEHEWTCSEKHDGRDPILKWKEVPILQRFSIISIKEKKQLAQNFQSYIVRYVDKDDQIFKCYGPAHFIKEIRKHREMNFRPYFISHGTVEYGSREIAKFEIVYKKLDKEFEIFEQDDTSGEV